MPKKAGRKAEDVPTGENEDDVVGFLALAFRHVDEGGDLDAVYVEARRAVQRLLRSNCDAAAAEEWRDAIERVAVAVATSALPDREEYAVLLKADVHLLNDYVFFEQQNPAEQLLNRPNIAAVFRAVPLNGLISRVDLKASVGLKDAYLSQILKVLQTAGFVVRESRGKPVDIALTEKGRAAFRKKYGPRPIADKPTDDSGQNRTAKARKPHLVGPKETVFISEEGHSLVVVGPKGLEPKYPQS